MPRKVGRPRTPKTKALGKFISTRLKPEDYAEIRKAIQASGISQSNWIRDALINAARSK